LRQQPVQRVPQQQTVEQGPAQKRKRERQVGERREQQREGRAVLVEVEVLLGVRGVQVATGEQVEASRTKDAEVVGVAEDGLLHGDECRAREVQGEQEAAGPGYAVHHPPRRVPNLLREGEAHAEDWTSEALRWLGLWSVDRESGGDAESREVGQPAGHGAERL